jgi:HB1/ASXL restriction endonuclease-like protein with HTH domain/restriction endonuclease
MTFTEAAAEVLRLVGKPLHYKDITELAIEKNLLSHVGKSPEVTMGSRLAALLKKGPKENPLVRIKPGVFALRAWEETGPPGPPPEVKAAAASVEAPAAPAPAKVAGTKTGSAKSRGVTPAAGVPAAAVPRAAPAVEPAVPAVELVAPDDEGPPTTPAIGGAVSWARDEQQTAAPPEVAAPEAVAPVAAEIAPAAALVDDAAALSSPATEPNPEAAVPSAPSTAAAGAPLPSSEGVPESVVDPEVTVNALPRRLERGEAKPARDEAKPARDEARPARDEARPARDEARPPRDESRPRPPPRGPTAPDEAFRANLMEAAKDLFDEEEDDDKPIFGSDADAAEGAGGRRRRRRRRGRGAEGGEGGALETGLPAYTVSPAYGDAPPPVESAREAEPVSVRTPPRDAPREERREAPREDRREAPREGPRDDRREGRRDDRRDDRGPRPSVAIEGVEGGEADELAGRDLADVVASLLAGFDRGGGPVALRTLVEQAQRRGRLTGDPALLQAHMSASICADGLRRAAAGQRPRFRLLPGGRVAPVDWSLGLELVRLEAEMLVAVDRYREAARRAFARKLSELPAPAFVELCLTLIERLGVSGLKPVRRPASAGSESHFGGVLRGPAGETRIGVVIRRDGREVGRERVADLRGSLHHYGPASAGWIFTSGPVLSGARDEVAVVNAAPVALFDAAALARSCEEYEIAVTRTSVPLFVPDFETLDALRGGDR